MKFRTDYHWFSTEQHRQYINITDLVSESVRKSEVLEGMALVSAMHITAGVFVNDDEPGILPWNSTNTTCPSAASPDSWSWPASSEAKLHGRGVENYLAFPGVTLYPVIGYNSIKSAIQAGPAGSVDRR